MPARQHLLREHRRRSTTMAAGFFISKSVGIVAIVLGLGAVATIIALSVVYAQEKNKGHISDPGNAETTTAVAETTTTAIPKTTTTAVPKTTTTAVPATTAASSTTTVPDNPWNRWRLPTTLMPESYEVTLQPFLTPNANNMYIFKGNSSVVFVCKEATNLILIHSNKLNYTMQGSFLVSLEAVDGSSAPLISKTWLESSTQYLVVQLDGQLQKDQRYRLFSIFTGELADDLAGFYRSEYMDELGDT